MAPPCRFCGGWGAYGWRNYDDTNMRTCANPHCVTCKLPAGILARLDHEKVYDPFRQCGWLGDRVSDLFKQREALADELEEILLYLDPTRGSYTGREIKERIRIALRAAGRMDEPQASAAQRPSEAVPEIDRLKAENASLLEWKAKAMLRLIGLEPVHDEVAAAEQRAEAAEKERDHFIREAGDWQLFANEQEQRAIAAEARAALHDEERSAPPGPVECMPPYAPHAMVGEDCCLAFSDHMKEPPTAGECCKHHAAAQGEEK